MLKIFYSIKDHGQLSAFIMLCICILLGSLLRADEQNYQPPQQEYENNEVKISRIVFSQHSGFYDEPFTLKIKAPTSEIYYTLDGSEPVRGQENTFRYEDGIEIDDASSHENVHCLRTDVTAGFDLDAVENLSKGRRPMNYQVPDYPVDKCTILRAAFYDIDDERSEVQTASYFVGYKDKKGYGGIKVLSIVTDPANLFDYENGIYVTGKTFDDFAAADSFHNDDIWYRHFWWWWDANYHNSGRDWERKANVQFFSEDGNLLLQQDAGIRIQGGGSRGFLPKSLNLYSRTEYDGDSTFHYDFFGTGYTAKRLTLTCGGDDCYSKLKDRLVSELADEQDFATMHYEPWLMFLDGEFWGVYNLTEKYDEKYFSKYYDVPREEVLEIKNNEVEVGVDENLALYEEMKSFIEESDMSEDVNYKKACELIDMDSFINYYAALIYCGRCGDWPNGNFALWRTREAPAEETPEDSSTVGTTDGIPEESSDTASGDGAATSTSDDEVSGDAAGTSMSDDSGGENAETSASGTSGDVSEVSSPYRDGRWRWILFDVNSEAISSELTDHDTLRYVIKANKMKMFSSLCESPEFRRKFKERILEYGNTIFSPDTVNAKIDQYMEVLTDPMEIHFRRFFGEDSGLDFPTIVDTEIRGFFAGRYKAVEQMLEDNFGDYDQ